MPDPCINCGDDNNNTLARCDSCGANVCGDCERENMCLDCAEFHLGPSYCEEAMDIDRDE